MVIKLLRYGIVEHEFFDRPTLEKYAIQNIGVKVSDLGRFGYTIKTEVE